MTSATRIKFIITLLMVCCLGHSYAKLREVRVQDDKVPNKDLQSKFDTDWEGEDTPLNEDNLNSILKDIFESDGEEELESSVQSNLKPNLNNIQSIFDLQTNTQNENKSFVGGDINENSTFAWQDSQKSPREELYYGGGETVFPIKSSRYNGALPYSQNGPPSSVRPDIQITNSPSPSFKPKTEASVDHITTPSYWYGEQGNISTTNKGLTFKNEVSPSEPIFNHPADNTVNATTPRFAFKNHTEVKSNMSPYLISNQDGLNNTPVIIWLGKLDSVINSTHPTFNSGNQSGPSIQSPFNPNNSSYSPIGTNVWPRNQDAIRNTHHNFAYNYQRTRPIKSHFWSFSPGAYNPTPSRIRLGNQGNVNQASSNLSPSERPDGNYPIFWPGSPWHAFSRTTNFRPGYQSGVHPISLNFNPRGYHYHRSIGRNHHYSRDYQIESPDSNSQVEHGPLINRRNRFEDHVRHYHNRGGYRRHNPPHINYRHHHRHNHGIHHSHGSMWSYR